MRLRTPCAGDRVLHGGDAMSEHVSYCGCEACCIRRAAEGEPEEPGIIAKFWSTYSKAALEQERKRLEKVFYGSWVAGLTTADEAEEALQRAIAAEVQRTLAQEAAAMQTGIVTP